jgi:hypothetical protein
MGRGKRREGTLARQTSGVALREIPLSDSTRGRRPVKVMPTFASLSEPLIYDGDFNLLYTRLVGLHARKTWDLAKEIHRDTLELELEHEMLNEHDPRAVGAYLKLDSGGRELIGYVDGDDAPELAKALDGAAKLRALPRSHPWAGQGSKGGSLDIKVFLAE